MVINAVDRMHFAKCILISSYHHFIPFDRTHNSIAFDVVVQVSSFFGLLEFTQKTMNKYYAEYKMNGLVLNRSHNRFITRFSLSK